MKTLSKSGATEALVPDFSTGELALPPQSGGISQGLVKPKLGFHPSKGTDFCTPEVRGAEPLYLNHPHWVIVDKAFLFSSVKHPGNNRADFKSVLRKMSNRTLGKCPAWPLAHAHASRLHLRL